MRQKTIAIAPSESKVYYTGSYWNDFPEVREELNRRASSDAGIEWYKHFFSIHKKQFKKVLMLNCGNGWVERDLFALGNIKELVGVDYSEELLDEARNKADKLPFRYYQMDINIDHFPEEGFDLVINHAAAHHIAMLNRVFVELLKVMTKDALFLNYDFIGPHRNQYPAQQWSDIFELNQTLPASCRQELKYPHLPTMLATDPSEAVHSELIVPTMKRYFNFQYYRPLGGALAYPILTHNINIQTAPKHDISKTLQIVLEADLEYAAKHPESAMFAYWVAKPTKEILANLMELKEFQKDEEALEERAKDHQGYYYELSLLQNLYFELENLQVQNSYIKILKKQIKDFQKKMENAYSSRLRKIGRLLNKKKSKP